MTNEPVTNNEKQFSGEKSSRRRGQMSVEAIIAANILVVGLLGMLALLNRSLGLARTVSNNYIGTYLASEGIEIVKNLIDTNIIQSQPWNCGLLTGNYEADYLSSVPPSPVCTSPYLSANLGRNLFFDPTTTKFYSYSGAGSQTNFTRHLRITMIGADEMRVNSIVTWSTGMAQSSLNVEDHFFNWRP